MKRCFIIIFFLCEVSTSHARLPGSYSDVFNEAEGKIIPVNSIPNLFKWTDICNVYILRHEDKALLIDLGDGSVLEKLHEIGIKQTEWVLFTHHHREQCQGYPLLSKWDANIAVPLEESAFFENPASFIKMKPSLNDPYTVYGSSYLRPPVHPIKVTRKFSKMDSFTWHGYEFWCVGTPGNSPGAMSYVLKQDEKLYVFSGDVILDGAKMHNYFDSEWDYGFGKGIRTLYNSATLIRDFHPDILLPSHGKLILDPEIQLDNYLNKLLELDHLIPWDWGATTLEPSFHDSVSKPTEIPWLWQITPHLFKLKGPDYSPNFSMIMSDNGHALMVDCGLEKSLLEKILESMRLKYGLKQIDALIVTHIHGDHYPIVPYLRQKWKIPVWALENMVPIMEQPERFNIPAMMWAYNAGFDTIKVDRAFKPGEKFQWEGYNFTIDWMPGQTEYALCMHGVIDNRKVAFTGDNIFGNPANAMDDGNEALIARNSAIPEEGFIYGAEYLTGLKPDIIAGGHAFVFNKPSKLIGYYREWAYKIRDALEDLSDEMDYRFWFDPYWIHADPYRTRIKKGETVENKIVVRNFSKSSKPYNIEFHTPAGIVADPAYLDVTVTGESRETFPVKFTALPDAAAGRNLIAFDVTINEKRFGEWFDAIIEIVEK